MSYRKSYFVHIFSWAFHSYIYEKKHLIKRIKYAQHGANAGD